MLEHRIVGSILFSLFPFMSWGVGSAVTSGSGTTVTQIQASDNQKDQESAKNAKKMAQSFTPEQSLQLARLIQSSNLDAARIGQEKGQQNAVKTYAQQLERDYKGLDQAVENYQKKHDARSQTSPVAQNLETTWRKQLEALKAIKKGPEFDQAFLGHEIKMQQEALQLVQTGLKASASNPDLKEILQKTETTLNTDLQRAQYVQKASTNERVVQ